MEFTQTYVRNPFYVDAIQITKDNIHILAPYIGRVATEGDKQFIEVDRKVAINVFWNRVDVGCWVTWVEGREGVRCYSDRAFQANFSMYVVNAVVATQE